MGNLKFAGSAKLSQRLSAAFNYSLNYTTQVWTTGCITEYIPLQLDAERASAPDKRKPSHDEQNLRVAEPNNTLSIEE